MACVFSKPKRKIKQTVLQKKFLYFFKKFFSLTNPSYFRKKILSYPMLNVDLVCLANFPNSSLK